MTTSTLTPTVGQALAAARAELEPVSDEARIEAELLLAHAIGTDRARLLAAARDPLSPEAARRFRGYLERRLRREPTAYILGHKEFYELDFDISPAALIPRPESEALVELALLYAEAHPGALTIADIGTGCGAIAVSIAHALPRARVIATDISRRALALARRNAGKHGVAGRIEFRHGSVLGPLDEEVDIIVANLPYVATEHWRTLPPELRANEPRLAFDGGPDGLRLIRRLLRAAPARLKPGGALFAEIDHEQAAAVLALVERHFPGAAREARKDLANLDRVVCVYT